MADISGMLTTYIYLLFGSLLFVVVLAAMRALGGGDVGHGDVVIDHSVDVGSAGEVSHMAIGHTIESGDSGGATDSSNMGAESSGDVTKAGLVKFQGMTLMTVSIFLVSFSAMGILSLYYFVEPYGLDPLASIPVAGVISAALALGLSYFAFKYFIESAAGSEISLREAVGRPCEVTVGASGEGLGEVSCGVKGQIMSFSARSLDGSRLNVGDSAVIIRMTGNIAVVQKRLNP